MKKIYVLVALAIIGILGSCAIVNAAENIIDLGTIKYSNISEKTRVVEINSSDFVDLQYVSSDINKSSLCIFSCWFSPLDNKTTYVFASAQIEADWWFINDTKSFIYQDNSTKQLYRINIDYSAIEVPPDPLIEWMNEYDILANSSSELQELFNTTLNELNETRKELQEKWNTFNQSQEKFDNNSAMMITMQEDLDNLQLEYDEKEALWLSASQNLSIYTMWYDTLAESNEKLQNEYDGLSGMCPIYVFFTVIGTSIILIIWFKRKKILGQEAKSDIKTEIETGYGQDAKKWDKFSVNGIISKLTPKQRRKSETNMQDIHKKIDGIKSENDTFRKSIVKDFRDIETRVDDIETKLETKTGK
jgi:hypothetical protein